MQPGATNSRRGKIVIDAGVEYWRSDELVEPSAAFDFLTENIERYETTGWWPVLDYQDEDPFTGKQTIAGQSKCHKGTGVSWKSALREISPQVLEFIPDAKFRLYLMRTENPVELTTLFSMVLLEHFPELAKLNDVCTAPVLRLDSSLTFLLPDGRPDESLEVLRRVGQETPADLADEGKFSVFFVWHS